MVKQYKKPLTLDEQIEHLQTMKRVHFSVIDKTNAKKALYEWNYINVISPFKSYFAKKDNNGYPIKDSNDCHVYPRDIEFKEYYDAYKAERKKYPKIYKKLLIFEEHFNAILSYEVLNHYQITDSNAFEDFKNNLVNNINTSAYPNNVKQKMLDDISKFDESMNKYESIYIFLDRMSLSRLITVFRACDYTVRQRIFDEMLKRGFTLGYVDLPTFDKDLLNRIVPIRNCVCHGNSIEILLSYFDIKDKTFRRKSDKKRYVTIIKKLTS